MTRAVWDRDGGRCSFVSTTGQRCGSDQRVELHHVVPFAKGGVSTVGNIALRCAAHNAYEAELAFGRSYVEAVRQR